MMPNNQIEGTAAAQAKKPYEAATLTELGWIADLVEGFPITGSDGLPVYNLS